MTGTIADLIKVAKNEVGYHEGRTGMTWNNRQKYSDQVPGLSWSDGQPWCATFVSWCAMKADLEAYFPSTASTDAGAKWFKDRRQWSAYPAVGAQVFYGHNGDMNHTGIVYGYDSTYIYTIEGNTNTSGSAEGDGVYLKKRARHDDYVQGYGYPKIPGGLKAADPNYKPPAAASSSTGSKPPAAHQRVMDDWTAHRVVDMHHLSAVQGTDRQPWADAAYRFRAAVQAARAAYVKATQR